MRKFFRWTVVFRGKLRRNGINMFHRTFAILEFIGRFILNIIRFQLRVICFVLGIDWIRLERSIQRRLRIYFT